MTGMGISRLAAKKILNHAERDVTTVYDRHSYDPEKRTALEAWGRRLETIVTGAAGPGSGIATRSESVEERFRAALRRTIGDIREAEALRDPLARRGDEADLDSQASQHVDESVGAKKIDATAQHVADSRLANSEELGGLSLLQAPRLKLLLEPDHEVGAHEEVLCLVGREPKISEDVSAGASHSRFGLVRHRTLRLVASAWPSRLRATSISLAGVFRDRFSKACKT
jgi:hypothetical protein